MGKISGCCGCFDLPNGGIAVGVASLAIACCIISTCLFSIISIVDLSPQFFTHSPTMAYVFGVIIAVYSIAIVFSSLLVHGTKTGRRTMVLAWMIFSLVYCSIKAIAVVIIIGYMIYTLSSVNMQMPPIYVLTILVQLGWSAAEWYWLFVVFHCYQVMPSVQDQLGGQFSYHPQGASTLQLNGGAHVQ